MEQLKGLFEKGRSCTGALLEKLQQEQLLSEGDILEIMRFFDELMSCQKQCIDAFVRETGCAPEDCTSLAAMDRIREESALRQARLHRLAEAKQTAELFLSVDGGEAYAQALEPHKSVLRALTDDELLARCESGGLDPYRRFADCVLACDDVRREMVDDALTAAFGFQLCFGLLKGAFALAPRETAEETPVIEEEIPTVGDEAPAIGDEASVIEEEAPVIEEPADPFESLRMPVSELGALEISCGKPLKGFSSMQSYLKKQPWSYTYAISNVLSALMLSLLASREHIGNEVNPDVPAGMIDQSLDRLFREGYIIRYSAGDSTLYTLSPAARQILSSSTTQQRLHWEPRRPCLAKELSGPAAFARFSSCMHFYAGKSRSTLDFTSHLELIDDYSTMWFSYEQPESLSFLLYAPLLYTTDDAPESLLSGINFINARLAELSEGAWALFAAPAAQLEQWKTLVAERLHIPGGVRVLFGALDSDCFADEEGHTFSFDDARCLLSEKFNPEDKSAEAPAPETTGTPEITAGEPVPAIGEPEPIPEESAAVQEEPVSITEAPMAAPEEPEGVTEAPAAVQEEPEAIIEQPAAAPAEPEGVTEAPAAVQEEPEAIIEQHAAVQEEPEAAEAPEADVAGEAELLPEGNVRGLAHAILSSPDPLGDADALHALLIQLLRENRPMEAVVLARTLADSPRGADFQSLYHALLHGANLPLEHREYSNAYLEQPESGDPLTAYCRIAFMLWALCFPQIPYDHALYGSVRSTGDMALTQTLPEAAADLTASLKQVLALLTDDLRRLSFERLDGLGFSPSVRSLLLSDSMLEARRLRLMERAAEKRPSPRSSIAIRGLEAFLKDILGPTSLLGAAMSRIADGRTDGLDEARAFLEACSSGGSLSYDALHEFIDAGWNAARRKDKGIQLKTLANDSPARNLALRELEIRLSILSEWFRRGDDASTDVRASASALKALTGKLLKHLDDAREACALARDGAEPEDCAGLTLLRGVLARIASVLRGEQEPSPEPAACFAPLLTSGHMLLDGDGYPVLERDLNELPGMEPWRLMLEHLRAEPCSLEEALRRIEIQGLDPARYEDYGSAILIRRALGLSRQDYLDLCLAALTDCREREESFCSDVRLACAYGQIAESTKETVFAQAAKFRHLFICDEPEPADAGSYAHFRRMLDVLQAEIIAAKQAREADFRSQLGVRMQALGPVRDVPRLLERIREEIDSGNFAMAEEYLNRYDSGETDAAANVPVAAVDFHARFLECADYFCEQCERPENRGRQPSDWGPRVLRSRNFWSNRNEKNTDSLLNCWIVRMGASNTPAQIARFLNMLGIRTAGVKLNRSYPSTSQYEVFQAEVTPAPTGLPDYAHPVPKFGTKQSGSLNVVCLYGCKGAATLIDIMTQKLQLSDTAIVLMDGVLSRLERRKIATTFKSATSGQNSFLLIDRVLLLYLAALDRGSQLTAMLQCTLPYTYEQLYTEGSGPVADEMFIGRISERKSLADPNGACLVYGGRQLGKTALLRRVESICMKPEEGNLAAYIDIKEKKLDYLVSELNHRLSALEAGGRPLLDRPCETLSDVCRAISARRNDFHRLTILVDESDRFFEEIAPLKYEPLHPIVTLRQELGNRVKFVFAGTHNVAATAAAISDNSDILQFGKPLCIEPLSMADATRLIRLPLSYLGFSIGERQIALILANTNSYPGLIHLFCSSLIKSVCDNYGTYYSESRGNPPYTVSDEQLKAIFRETDIKREIERRVIATIKLDRKYRIVSNLMAYLEYDAQEQGSARLYGYTPQELLECNQQEFEIPDFMPDRISAGDLDGLMSEMERMGILWKQPETARYRFRQRDFLGYIGAADQVMSALLYEERGGDDA